MALRSASAADLQFLVLTDSCSSQFPSEAVMTVTPVERRLKHLVHSPGVVQYLLHSLCGPSAQCRRPVQRRLTVADRPVPLAAKEFDLLRILSVSAGHLVTTEMLHRQGWGRRGSDNTDRVRTAVNKLPVEAR